MYCCAHFMSAATSCISTSDRVDRILLNVLEYENGGYPKAVPSNSLNQL